MSHFLDSLTSLIAVLLNLISEGLSLTVVSTFLVLNADFTRLTILRAEKDPLLSAFLGVVSVGIAFSCRVAAND